jgi:hypothetical protein
MIVDWPVRDPLHLLEAKIHCQTEAGPEQD